MMRYQERGMRYCGMRYGHAALKKGFTGQHFLIAKHTCREVAPRVVLSCDFVTHRWQLEG